MESQVIETFITGPTGAGKTYLSNKLALSGETEFLESESSESVTKEIQSKLDFSGN